MKHTVITFITFASLLSSANPSNQCHGFYSGNQNLNYIVQKLNPADVPALYDIVEKDPDLKVLLGSQAFIKLLKGVSENKSLDEMRETIYEVWNDPALSNHAMRDKLGANIVGPYAGNHSELMSIIKKIDLEEKKKTGLAAKAENAKFYLQRMSKQARGLGKALRKAKEIVNAEMDTSVLDANLFDFYGYLNLNIEASRLREWQTVPGSFRSIKLSDIQNMDPVLFVKIVMLASQIEAPIHGYSTASGEIFRLFPQASRFMGKTFEAAKYHDRTRTPIRCTASWCFEENRHEMMLELVARHLVGFVIHNDKPFSADWSLNPYDPKDVKFHVAARANNELAATSTYILLGAHAEGGTAGYLANIRQDEIKHSTIFAGLHHYLYGNTYWDRVRGIAKKFMIEIKDKGLKSEYSNLGSEMVTLVETLTAQVRYEQKIKNFMASIPLKTLRKFFETQINLDPLKSDETPADKLQKDAELLPIKKQERESLAGWPKELRERALALEAFEREQNNGITALVKNRFRSFRDAEMPGSAKENEYKKQISKLTLGDLSIAGIPSNKENLALVKESLSSTLRDYQIINNGRVRGLGLNVGFKDAVSGFDVLRDDAYASLMKRQKEISGPADFVPPVPPQATVQLVKEIGSSDEGTSYQVRISKPDGFIFAPGDAARLSIPSDKENSVRTLSIASSPKDPYLDFAVRSSDSFYKLDLKDMHFGQGVTVSKVGSNRFQYDPSKPAVAIAGGIGITPFRSMIRLRSQDEAATEQSFRLVFSNRTPESAPFLTELKEYVLNDPNLTVESVFTKSTGDTNTPTSRIDKPMLEKIVKESAADTIYYVVGPKEMTAFVRNTLLELGIPADRIKAEIFIGYSRTR
jgi:ferredoxin-NADP reductase